MLNLEEYNATFSHNLSKEDFDIIMGNPIKIQDAEELIFVDPNTHEKIVFKRVPEERVAEYGDTDGIITLMPLPEPPEDGEV